MKTFEEKRAEFTKIMSEYGCCGLTMQHAQNTENFTELLNITVGRLRFIAQRPALLEAFINTFGEDFLKQHNIFIKGSAKVKNCTVFALLNARLDATNCNVLAYNTAFVKAKECIVSAYGRSYINATNCKTSGDILNKVVLYDKSRTDAYQCDIEAYDNSSVIAQYSNITAYGAAEIEGHRSTAKLYEKSIGKFEYQVRLIDDYNYVCPCDIEAYDESQVYVHHAAIEAYDQSKGKHTGRADTVMEGGQPNVTILERDAQTQIDGQYQVIMAPYAFADLHRYTQVLDKSQYSYNEYNALIDENHIEAYNDDFINDRLGEHHKVKLYNKATAYFGHSIYKAHAHTQVEHSASENPYDVVIALNFSEVFTYGYANVYRDTSIPLPIKDHYTIHKITIDDEIN